MAKIHRLPRRSRESDRRRRSRRAPGLGHQRTGRELTRCRRSPHHHHRRVRRQEADSCRGRWRGDGAGGRAAGPRAACDEQDSPLRRSRRIATLGFRGEALPSIASVSHFILRSRARGAAVGDRGPRNGGTVASVMEAGMPEGTSIEVADVFYNLPARRKFLKSDGAESAQVSRIVTQLAFATRKSASRSRARAGRSCRSRLSRRFGTGCISCMAIGAISSMSVATVAT